MYHPQCELLVPHESLDMGVGQSHLAASAVAAIPAELNFHLLSYVDTGAVSAQPSLEYLFGGTDHQLHTQLEQLATNHQAMAMLRDYYGQYPADETYLGGGCGGPRTAGSSSLVLGAADDESAYMTGRFELECSPKAKRRSRKRSRGGFHGGGVEKKEKQRRQRLSDKYTALMLLIPSRTKEDRATVISDAIEYIKELGRTVEELTLLVEKKRRRREQSHSHQLGDVVDAAAVAVAESSVQPIRSTFLQRKSKETLVDVRIVADEVNIKLTKRHRDGCGCLAAAARVLDDLCLELVHLSGGKIGNCHIYMFNTKIHQGSPVFASAVASKLIQAVDDEY